MTGATVEVKNSTGVVVPVVAHDLAVGTTTTQFDFVTPVVTTDLTGVWTVNGKEYSFTAIKLVADINAAAAGGNQVAFLNALNAAGIQNVKVELIADYATLVANANPQAATIADVQKIVDDKNKAVTDSDDALAKETAKVKAVADATNQVQLLTALQANFDRVNADWIVEYANKAVTTTGTPTLLALDANHYVGAGSATTAAAIQVAIDAINDTKVQAAYGTAFASLNSTDSATAKSLINTYIADDETVAISAKDYYLDSVAVLDAVIAVTKAPTNNSLKTALVALNNLETSLVTKYQGNVTYTVNDDLNITTVSDALLTDYRTALAAAVNDDKNQRSDIQTIITNANAAKAVAQLAAVTSATTADTLLAALKAYPGLTQVADSNKAFYFGADATSDFAGVDASTIQGTVDAANLTAIKTAADADKLLVAFSVVGTTNVKAENKAAYFGSLTGTVATGEIADASNAADVQTAVNAINTALVATAQVAAINSATTATQVNDALLALGLDDYLNVPSVDRMYVAEGLLVARGTSTYADLAAVKDALFKSGTPDTGVIAAYKVALGGVNALTSASTITDAITALSAVGNTTFNNMTAAQKATIAENFLAACDFSGTAGALKTPFKTLEAIKALMK